MLLEVTREREKRIIREDATEDFVATKFSEGIGEYMSLGDEEGDIVVFYEKSSYKRGVNATVFFDTAFYGNLIIAGVIGTMLQPLTELQMKKLLEIIKVL